MEEVWKDIVGFDGYQISNYGNVRTNVPPCGRGRSNKEYPWRAVNLVLRKGCLQVSLRILLPRGAQRKGLSIATLLWKAFIGEDIPEGYTVDHIDRNPLNNKIENLRLASKKQQAANRNKMSHKSGNVTLSKYKGVSLQRDKYRPKPWICMIRVNGKHLYLGHYKTEKEAAIAYDKKAVEVFGEYAKLNFEKEA